MPNLEADIVPGESAAGFRIGQRYSEIQVTELSNGIVREWDKSQGTLLESIQSTAGWLFVDERKVSMRNRPGSWLMYNRGAISLQFNTDGVLYSIAVYSGYGGLFAGVVRVGDRLDKVLRFTNLFYDSGDETHYPVEGTSIRGIGFIGNSASLEEDPDQLIHGISVHDWSLQDGGLPTRVE